MPRHLADHAWVMPVAGEPGIGWAQNQAVSGSLERCITVPAVSEV
jgi:hypothetical protein